MENKDNTIWWLLASGNGLIALGMVTHVAWFSVAGLIANLVALFVLVRLLK